MKLFINSGSPFARKCRIVVHELGLTDRVDMVSVVTTDSAPDHVAVNPFAQIPALITDTGETFIDSTLICEWLAAHYGGFALYPEGEAYWAARQLMALTQGVLEASVKRVIETRRPESERSAFWLKRWEDGIHRGFAAIEAVCPEVTGAAEYGLAEMSVAIAATYAAFRFPDIDWLANAPKIAALTATLEKRQSFIDTYPS
ncbi:glutathione S-transferase N-terminal domain-containing protein [Asticcacaulis sp. BYS171W]|uniref:Glutathione S-transferase N-terminal domain-containing protein n=1 Tax=Asticcacaulis aquaticus TaxID=2984212 RepID=A0ABT5HXI3_9CAUL|nr:glutathione S-transferase N-terminal domain-containing protein [Asticcacaulis aquaticus]MDC7684738.1 glutathione S-transferase N-terminal domain-containing protein [Asticcacaulis aquaticus]